MTQNFLMIRRPPRSTRKESSAASDVYKRQGLEALLGDDNNSEQSNDQLKMISIEKLSAGKYQPRSIMDPKPLEELAESIKAQGIMQPILVRMLTQNDYEIVAGERRWRAAKLANLTEVPVLIKKISDSSALAMALI